MGRGDRGGSEGQGEREGGGEEGCRKRARNESSFLSGCVQVPSDPCPAPRQAHAHPEETVPVELGFSTILAEWLQSSIFR